MSNYSAFHIRDARFEYLPVTVTATLALPCPAGIGMCAMPTWSCVCVRPGAATGSYEKERE